MRPTVPTLHRFIFAFAAALLLAGTARTQTTLNGSVIAGNTTVTSSQTLTLLNGAGYTGTTTIAGALYLGSNLTAQGNATWVLNGSGSRIDYTSGGPWTLSLPSAATLNRTGSGYSYLYDHLSNAGTALVDGGTLYGYGNVTNNNTFTVSNGATYAQQSGYSFTNNAGATATVTGSGSVMRLNNLTNTGNVFASAGATLQLAGTTTTAKLGSVALSTGAAAEIVGTIDNTAASSNLAAPAGGTFTLKGTILGGTIDESALTQSAGTLDGATITGNVSVGSSASLTLQNGAGFTGNATVNGAIYLGSNVSLLAGSTLNLTGNGSRIDYFSTKRTLTVAATSTLLRSGSGYSYLYDDALNQGTFSVTGGTLYGYGNITNQGTLSVSGGASLLQQSGYAFNNAAGHTASVSGAGSVLFVYNPTNAGTLSASSGGLIQLSGTFTTPNLGTVDVSNSGSADIHGTLTNTSSNLTAPTGGTYTVSGTILGGNVADQTITAGGGTLDGATLNGNLTIASNQTLTLQNNAQITGNTTVNGILYLGSDLTFAPNGILALTGSGSQLSYTAGTRRTLTIPVGATLNRSGSGYSYQYDNVINSGNVSVSGGTLYGYGNITNQGSMSVTAGASYAHQSGYVFTNTAGHTASVSGSGSTLKMYNVSNAGTLSASSGGLLQFAGSFATADLGTVDLTSGGSAEIVGTVNNASATLSAPISGTYALTGTILGGTLNDQTITPTGGTLDGVTLTGNLTIASNQSLVLQNGAQITGNTTVNSGILYLGSDLTMAPNATIALIGSGSQLSYTNGTRRTLTIPVGATVSRLGSGYSYQYDNLANSGNISVSGGTLYGYGNTTNQGTLSVTGGATYAHQSGYVFTNAAGHTASAAGSGSTLKMYNVSNAGTLSASSGGLLQFAGSFATSDLGTVDLSSGGLAEIVGTLNNASATLSAPTSGTYALTGTIVGGNINDQTITANGGTLDGATLTGNLTIGSSQSLVIQNGAQITGNTTVNSGLLFLGSDLTLAPNATLALTGSGSQLTYTGGTRRTLTIPSGAVVSRYGSGYSYQYDNVANSGNISVSGGTLYGYGNVTNQGNISVTSGAAYTQQSGYNFTNAAGHLATASGSASTLTMYNVSNSGSLTADNGGTLRFSGTFATPDLGSVDLTNGGFAEIVGTLNNASATLSAPTSGTYALTGTILGGNINDQTITPNTGTLDGATLNGNLTIGSSQSLTLQNGAQITGNTTVNSGLLYLGTDLTLAPNATIALTGSGSQLTYTSGTRRTLTIPAGASVSRVGSGYSYQYDNLANSGNISISGGTLYGYGNVTNLGNFSVTGGASYVQQSGYALTIAAGHTVSVSGSGSLLSLNSLTNSGTLAASNGGNISLAGTFTTANLGTIDVTGGGNVLIGGTVDNTSATLTAPIAGPYWLTGGMVKNGTIANGALSFTNSGGTLKNVMLSGDVTMPANSSAIWTAGTALMTPNATLTLGSSASLSWQQSGTFASDNLTFGNNSYIYVNGGNAALTLDGNTTASGAVQIYSDGSAGTSVTNQGTITHTSGTGYFSGNSTTNSGTIAVNGGTLYFGANLTGATAANNAGATLRVNGGALSIQLPSGTPLVNQGTIDVQSGTFYTNNRLTNGATGTLQGAGNINGNVTIAGGTIAPGNNGIGSLIITSGTLTVTGAATFAADISGSSSDQLKFQSPGGIINLGSGLLSLSLTLLTAPTANTTYNLITVSNGLGISGSFAGLPNNGDTLTANFGGNPFTFSINYQSNAVALTYTPVVVPEPSTYLLMAGGLLALFGAAKRKRKR